jgi:hypothetical protein
MKKIKFICFAALFGVLSNCTYSQADSLITNKTLLSKYYVGFGAGFCNKGLEVGLSSTFILSNDWGGSIRFNSNFFEAKNLPPDYYDFVLFMPFLSNGLPSDNVNVLSFNLIKEFPTRSKLIRFGIEMGPSLVNYKIANFRPVSNPIPFLGSNYDIIRDKQSTVGLSLRLKAEFPLTRFAGLEIAAYTNVNGLQSVSGIELICLNLGLLREK